MGVWKISDVINEYDCIHGGISLPDIQRELNSCHVTTILEGMALERTEGRFSNWGVMEVAQCMDGDTAYLVDGQHRVEAMRRVVAENPTCADEAVYIHCVIVKDMQELRRYWQRVNSSRQAHIVKCAQVQEVYNNMRRFFEEKFRSNISLSQKPKRPNVNLSKMADVLDRLIITHGLDVTQKQLLVHRLPSVLLEMNHYLQKKTSRELTELLDSNSISIINRLGQAGSARWYCGLYDLYDILEMAFACIFKSLKVHDMNFQQNRRKTVSAHMRRETWAKHNQRHSKTGTCYVCNANITLQDFHCAHVIPRIRIGGTNEVSNMQPTCKSCNSEMSIENLEDFKKRLLEY